MKHIGYDVSRGVVMAILYLELTKANDTTAYNIGLFTTFYVVIINTARLLDIEPAIVTNAFLTKCIFTLVDERIKRS